MAGKILSNVEERSAAMRDCPLDCAKLREPAGTGSARPEHPQSFFQLVCNY